MLDYPAGLLAVMDDVIRAENRQRRIAERRARSRGRS